MFHKYGKLINNTEWPIMDDGSKMKFIPIIRGKMSSEVIDSLSNAMEMQIGLKSEEISLDLPLKNIFENKAYLEGNTIEQIIHGVKRLDKNNMPVFKHITKKWSKDPNKVEYQVAIQAIMEKDAIDIINNLEAKLIEAFGEKVKDHFTRQINPMHQGISNKHKIHQQKSNNGN